ncbi:metal-dependent hydrolase [Photobacterium proteolyticum]|uniref:Metal-dependent hydrolase n=1 Tax=Photobacterium proteolyticum TaxID=1903952 RepID=A0A1Q9GMN0_9GAMM|nr:metal-dependent hydrolase [Photobacterium proteolyticum]OLQ75913.1 metal-dependent hydrolase [Photobacterium proteolyticum]
MSVVTPTQVLFAQPQWQAKAEIQLCLPAECGGSWLVTDRTPFHPVSHIWPDHPADQGEVIIDGRRYAVAGCYTGAVELASGNLFVGKDIPVKRDTDGWAFVVVHHTEHALELAAGALVELDVDKVRQQALSRGHSGGHLSSLALNKVLHHDFWRKDASRKDEMGHYDFHSYAQTESQVSEDCSTDTYRLGKTLRKRGLNSADLLQRLDEVEARINQQLEAWRMAGAAVVMRCEGKALTDSRYWQCELENDVLIEIPCGGTHIGSLADYSKITVEFQIVSDQELVMITRTAA